MNGEKFLQSREPSYSSRFFDAMPTSAYVIDASYTVLDVNAAVCDCHQMEQHEVLGQKCYTLFGEVAPCQNCPVPQVIASGRPLEKEIFRKAEKTWHFLRAFLIEGENEQAIIGTVTRDITASKNAEKVLEEFDSKIKHFIDRMPIGCILWDQDFKAALWNPAAEKIFGYSETDARGKHPYSMIVPPDVVATTEPVKTKLLKGHDSSHRLGENVTQSGERIWCNWVNTPIQDAEGDVIAVLSMVQDMTKERCLQQEAIRAAQLASIGQLAAGVAHEVNNPITGVINYTQLLLNKRETLAAADVEILERIIKESGRIAGIVGNLLNFARKPAEQMVPQDVRKIVDEAVNLLSPELKKCGFELRFDLLDDEPKMRCNPQQIEQILVNLLKNAIDALREGNTPEKRILISSREQCVGNQKEFILSVANNGPHIPEHLQEKVFEPFMTTKRRGYGTGLGLGISLEIMKNHGGTLRLNSRAGEWTELQLVFPLCSEEDAPGREEKMGAGA